MASAWGGYIFISNVVAVYGFVMVASRRFNDRVYTAYCTFFVLGTILAMQVRPALRCPWVHAPQTSPSAAASVANAHFPCCGACLLAALHNHGHTKRNVTAITAYCVCAGPFHWLPARAVERAPGVHPHLHRHERAPPKEAWELRTLVRNWLCVAAVVLLAKGQAMRLRPLALSNRAFRPPLRPAPPSTSTSTLAGACACLAAVRAGVPAAAVCEDQAGGSAPV